MSKAIYYEIPAKQTEKILKFYSEVFGWKMDEWEGGKYWGIDAGGKNEKGIDGGIFLSEKLKTVVVTISVPDLKKTMDKVIKMGGKIIIAPSEEKWGAHGYFMDPEGTVFAMMEPKK